MALRNKAYGQAKPFTFLDWLGGALSRRRIEAEAGPSLRGDLADIGCGYRAVLSRSWAGRCRSLSLVDLALDPGLRSLAAVRCIEGRLPGALSRFRRESLDMILLNNILEHLDEPQQVLGICRHLLRPEGRLLINVPNWAGKWALEFSAFRLGLSTPEEIDDHRRYYDPKELWPMLVRAGFKPSRIRCYRHKLFLNTFAACIK
jgi:SAM-dependent methyltransferase